MTGTKIIEVEYQWSQVLDLADKNFKATIINVFKELKKVWSQLLKRRENLKRK